MSALCKVVSIVGTGRSGTTILSSILGQLPGVFSAGELRWLWERDLPQQRGCGCGNQPAACPVWSVVVEQLLGVPAAEQHGERLRYALRDVVASQQYLGRVRNRMQVLSTPSSPQLARPQELKRMIDLTASLVEALAHVTGAHTIIDSSKRPEEAAVLAACERFQHYVVHVVRDPRAVVHSWGRAKPVPAGTGRATMGTRRPTKTVLRWNENAIGAEVLRRHISPERWLFLRYEDFAQHPRAAIDRVRRFIDEPGPAPFITDDTVVLETNHNLSGNPIRFVTGPVKIAADEEWRTRLPVQQRFMIPAATTPFLLHYGYPLRTTAHKPT